MPYSADRYDHRCKVCFRSYQKGLKLAKKNAPPKPEACDCCGRTDKPLVVDHVRETCEVRGWLCNNCNKSIGALGDNLDGVMNAVRYLTRNETTN